MKLSLTCHLLPQVLQQLPKIHAYTRGSPLYLQGPQTRNPPPPSAEWQHPYAYEIVNVAYADAMVAARWQHCGHVTLHFIIRVIVAFFITKPIIFPPFIFDQVAAPAIIPPFTRPEETPFVSAAP